MAEALALCLWRSSTECGCFKHAHRGDRQPEISLGPAVPLFAGAGSREGVGRHNYGQASTLPLEL